VLISLGCFFEKVDTDLKITDIFLLETLRTDLTCTEHKMLPCLRYLPDFKVTDAFMSAANNLALGKGPLVEGEIELITLKFTRGTAYYAR
jgi:hypothetical protein